MVNSWARHLIKNKMMGKKETTASSDILSLEDVRTFIETSRSRILPERVAEMISERTFITEFSQELKELFNPLIENLRERLTERGVDVSGSRKWSKKLTVKEQRMVNSLCILQTALADSFCKSGSGRTGEARRYACQAQEACKLAGNYHLLTATMDMEASRMRDQGDNTGALRKQQEAYRIGVEQNDQEIIQRSFYNQSATLRTLGRYAEAIDMLYKVIETRSGSDQGADRYVQGLAYNQLAWVLLTIEDTEGAYQATCSGLELVASDIPSVQINLLITQSFVCQAQEDYTQAFESTTRGLKIAREQKESAQIASLLTSLGKVQAALGDIDEARSAYREAIDLFDNLEFVLHKEQARIALANLLKENGEYDEALAIYQELLAGSKNRHSDAKRYSWILTNTADLYVALQRFDEAEQMYRKALRLHQDVPVLQGTNAILFKLGKLYNQQGKQDEAIIIYERVINRLDVESSRTIAIDASRELAELYQKKGDNSKELVVFKVFHDLSMKAKDDLLDHRLNHLRVRHKVEQHKAEAELERLRREKIEAKLQEMTLALTEKSELLGSLRKKVRDILRELDGEHLPVLDNALQQIVRHVAHTNQSNQNAVLQLGAVNEKFYSDLRRKHPDLTPGQMKLCGFIRAGMDKQDIMDMLHISLGSLNKQRYRLRRRLGLQTKEHLESYLAMIGVVISYGSSSE